MSWRDCRFEAKVKRYKFSLVTVAGVSQKGRRLGRWLAWEEARTLLQAPNPHSIRGMRDRALLGVLVT